LRSTNDSWTEGIPRQPFTPAPAIPASLSDLAGSKAGLEIVDPQVLAGSLTYRVDDTTAIRGQAGHNVVGRIEPERNCSSAAVQRLQAPQLSRPSGPIGECLARCERAAAGVRRNEEVSGKPTLARPYPLLQILPWRQRGAECGNPIDPSARDKTTGRNSNALRGLSPSFERASSGPWRNTVGCRRQWSAGWREKKFEGGLRCPRKGG
jgi:hypothetical protein